MIVALQIFTALPLCFLQEANMETGTRLRRLLGHTYDPGDNEFQAMMTSLKAKNVTASNLTNGIHLDLRKLVAEQKISRQECAQLHAVFLQQE